MHRRLHQYTHLLILFTLASVVFLQGAAFAESVTLQWDPNSESDLAGYNLYRSNTSGSGYSKINANLIPSTSFADSTISAGSTYFYVCTAVNTAGLESGYSNEVPYTATTSNTPPVAVNDSASTAQGTSVGVNVVANDSDPDGDPLQVTANTQPAHGSASHTTTTVTYSPAAGFVGSDSFSYTISDGNGGTDSATVSVVVTYVNHPPTAVADSKSLDEDTTASFNLVGNDSDPDGDSLQVTQVSSGAHGSTAIISTTSVRYIPSANYHGTDTFSYTVNDGNGGSDTAAVTVTVAPVNDSPTAQNDSASTANDTPVTVSVLTNDSDVDGDALAVDSVTQPFHGTSAVLSATTVRYTPQAGYEGSDAFTYTVSDGNGGTATANVAITVTPPANHPPTAANDTTTVQEDSNVTVNVTANDSDPDGDALTVSQVGSPSHGTAIKVSASSIRYTPSANFHGSDAFSYTVSDGNGGTDTATVSVTVTAVNDSPVAHDDTTSTPEDHSVKVSVLANDDDADGDTLQVASVGHPSHGTAVINADQTVTYTPTAGYHGADSFTYAINDGHGGTSTATVSVTVTSVNDPPTATSDSVTLQEDTSASIPVLANDSDPDGDTLTIISVTSPQHGTAVIQSGSIGYTPTADYQGSDSFSYTISDDHEATATGHVSVTVTSVNDQPVARNDTVTTSEGQPITVAVLANDTDVDGDTLTVLNVSTPAHGTAVHNADQTVTYTPATNFQGADSFSYSIDDGQGGSDHALVTVTVTAVTDAPQANDDLATTSEDAPVVVSVLSNDTDPDGDPLAVASVTQPSHGAAALEGTDAVRYTPVADYHGSDSFAYTVTDGSKTDTAVVLITVNSINDAPIAADDTASTGESQPVTIAVLANDSDVDGDSLTVSSVGNAPHGQVTIEQDQTLTYTPKSNFRSGTDAFTYTVDDGHGGTASANVTITVRTTENTAPTAAADVATTPEDQPVTLTVLANDSDPDADTLLIESVTVPAHGTAVIQDATRVLYTPAPDYFGSDSFSYVVTDGTGGSAQATVTVTVTPVNDSPAAADDQASVSASSSVLVPVLNNDTDVDGDTLTVTEAGTAQHGQTSLEGSNQIRYTPEAGFVGTDTFVYQVTDGKETSSAQVTVQVIEPSQESAPLIFPVSVDTGASGYLANTYVGVGLFNPGSSYEYVSIGSHSRGGSQLAEERLSSPLPPKGQTAFQTSELSTVTPDSISLRVAADNGHLQGFFMVGDYNARRLDGVGAKFDVSDSLYFPMVHEGSTESTLIQMMNPSDSTSALLTMELHGQDGRLLNKVFALVAPGGSFMGTATEVFGSRGSVGEGYVYVTSDTPVCGYEVVANQKNLSSVSGRRAVSVSRLVAPHFFVDSDGGNTVLRILNAGTQSENATVRVYDDSGVVLAEETVTLEAGQLELVSAAEVFGLGHHKPDALLSGSVELETAGGAPIVADVDFSGFAGKSATSVPMIGEGYSEAVFPQVAQQADGSIFTGLAVLNPSNETVAVTVEAYDENGRLAAVRDFDLAPRSRKVDLLNSATLFGPDFSQVKGHLRVVGSGKLAAYAIFGDARGEFLSTIEGQPKD